MFLTMPWTRPERMWSRRGKQPPRSWSGQWTPPSRATGRGTGIDSDPLLAAIADVRRRKTQAEEELRQLVAYGREFTRPRPYILEGLAAAGMSISGVRTAYDHDHVAMVGDAIGRPSRN